MKINGTIFSKPQQDQLKRAISAELDKVVTKVRPYNFNNSLTAYNYLQSVPLDKIKYITITANNKVWTLMPQTSTTEYAAIKAYSDDGGYTIIVLKINPNAPISFYIDTYSGGGRDKHMITNISEYTVYVEE